MKNTKLKEVSNCTFKNKHSVVEKSAADFQQLRTLLNLELHSIALCFLYIHCIIVAATEFRQNLTSYCDLTNSENGRHPPYWIIIIFACRTTHDGAI